MTVTPGVYILWVWGTQFLESGILNFGSCAERCHSELSPDGRDDLPNRCAFMLCSVKQTLKAVLTSKVDRFMYADK